MSLTQYLKTIEKELAAGNATEHTHRPALKSLIESLDEKVTATNEPQRIKCGAPDYIVTRGQIPLGYVEAKDVGISLDAAEKSEQLKRYRESLGNLILTDYLEFRWYVRPRPSQADPYPESELRMTARLARVTAGGKLRLEEDGAQQVNELLSAFLHAQVPTVQSAKELAVRMAALARLMRGTIGPALRDEAEAGTLHEQMQGFREVLIHDLTQEQFADMYAQTICYGLFAARCNAKGGKRFTRELAAYDLPKTNPFLRKMFIHIAGPDLDDRIAWAVDDLAELLHRADMSAILQDFGKSTRREDPVVHFYETFLAAYDPKMREARGVYYTPEPVVSYIVRSVDHILKTDFKLKDGLADSSRISIKSPDGKGKVDVHRVLILDPATGTGTFLYGVINQIYESFQKNLGMWSGYVSEHLLPRLFGFELLMAPYAVAHMKLGLQLDNTGYDFKAEERLRVYLTNTLEEAHEASKLPLFTQWLAEEANEASKIKQEAPVMVVLGNPPYSISSQNKGDWIVELIEDYKKALNEKKINIDDDFIKFIRFAQWRIEQTGYGVLAYITNHSYLDGVTHRRMRNSLMETFDDIYVLDLHGNSKRKERSPTDTKDENVFDIQQGVAISIFVKRSTESAKTRVWHSELWGLRKDKYARLRDMSVSTTKWKELREINRESCLGKFYFFTPKAFDNIDEYCHYWNLKDCYGVQNTGIQTKRDDLFIDFSEDSLAKRFQDIAQHSSDESYLRTTYELEDTSGWAVSKLKGLIYRAEAVIPVLYRPFDVRWLYFDPVALGRARESTMRHMIAGSNVGLVTLRINGGGDDFVCLSTRHVVEKGSLPRGNYSLFPLYLYNDKLPTNLFEDSRLPENRSANLAKELTAEFGARLGLFFLADGKGDQVETFGPEDVFDYMYAIFHSPTYRSRYAEFLKIDFPRLPLTSNVKLFRELSRLGSELVVLHLMDRVASNITTYPVAGASEVEKVRYTEPGEAGSGEGRVWINSAQYFEGVPPELWNLHVGGYQVLGKWLKDRKGRQLTYDDLTHYHHIVSALNETIRLMSELDALIEEHGGWPLQ